MSKRCIITYAAGAHEELLDVAMPTYKEFAHRHGYELIVGDDVSGLPPAWNKVPLLFTFLEVHGFEEVVWFDCDLVVTDPREDFPPLVNHIHSLVRHFAWESEVPNSGVWRLCKRVTSLLDDMMKLEVFWDHGWWEQAALMTLMGYIVPPQGSDFRDTKCRCVRQTYWYKQCQFMRLAWNSHPEYRAEHPRIVHCSYPDMPRRLDVMRALVKDPAFDYPRYHTEEDKEEVDY